MMTMRRTMMMLVTRLVRVLVSEDGSNVSTNNIEPRPEAVKEMVWAMMVMMI